MTFGVQQRQNLNNGESEKKFGTFEGVFLPNILTIIGVILFLRQGMVMGEAGLFYGFIIILIAHLVTVTTGLSLSAVSTNMHVRTGGAYYIISRSLGIEWGGCIGIPLALSQTLSIALYTLGFAESLRMLSHVGLFQDLAPLVNYPTWILASVTLAIMTILSFKGAPIVIKTQIVVLVLVSIALIAIFAGPRKFTDAPHIFGEFHNYSFWQVFAIFFPAVTGIMSGVSLSGNLKNPRSSIPKGTLLSIGVGFAIYLSLGLYLCYVASPRELLTDNNILLKLAWSPSAVLIGIWAATISSALGMVLSAPRTIQALATDHVLPSFLGQAYGKNKEPLVALIAALIVAQAAIILGKINLVAPVLSMFFLMTYGMLNLTAGLESLVGNPSYRPSIKFPWWISLIGAFCCFYVMFLINTIATLCAFGVVTIIFLHLKRRNLHATWGDLRRGFWLSVIRRSLLQMERFPEHPKNWRPNIMVVTNIPQGRLDLVELADWLGGRRGLVTLHHILVGPYHKMGKRRRMALNNLSRFIRSEHMNALPAVDVVEDRSSDIGKIVTSQGFGSFQPNTVMLDWNERSEMKQGEFEQLCQGVITAGKTLLVLRVDPDRRFGRRKRIDIWPSSDFVRMPTLLILGYLISQDEEWSGSKIHVHIPGDKNSMEQVQKVREALKESRIPVQTTFHDNLGDGNLFEHTDTIARSFIESDLVIVPFPLETLNGGSLLESMNLVSSQITRFPSVLLVRGQNFMNLSE